MPVTDLPTMPDRWAQKPVPVIYLGGDVVICQVGDAQFFAGRPTEKGVLPSTPPMTRAQIRDIASDALAGEVRVTTWPHLAATLAMGVMLDYRDSPDLPSPPIVGDVGEADATAG